MLLAVEAAQVEGRVSGLVDSNGRLKKECATSGFIILDCGQSSFLFHHSVRRPKGLGTAHRIATSVEFPSLLSSAKAEF